MSEDTADIKQIKREDAYNPQYDSPAKPGFKVTRRGFLQGAAVIGAGTLLGVPIGAALTKIPETSVRAETKDTVAALLEKKIKPEYLFTGKVKLDRETVFRDHPSITDSNTEGSLNLSQIKKINGVDITDQTVREFLISYVPFKTGFNVDTHMNDGKGLWGMALVTYGDNNTEELRYFSDSSVTESAGVVVPDRSTGTFAEVKEVTQNGIDLLRLPMVPRKDVGLVELVPPKAA